MCKHGYSPRIHHHQQYAKDMPQDHTHTFTNLSLVMTHRLRGYVGKCTGQTKNCAGNSRLAPPRGHGRISHKLVRKLGSKQIELCRLFAPACRHRAEGWFFHFFHTCDKKNPLFGQVSNTVNVDRVELLEALSLTTPLSQPLTTHTSSIPDTTSDITCKGRCTTHPELEDPVIWGFFAALTHQHLRRPECNTKPASQPANVLGDDLPCGGEPYRTENGANDEGEDAFLVWLWRLFLFVFVCCYRRKVVAFMVG